MSKAPATLIYWDAWVNDLALSRCSLAAQGAWMRILAKLHQSDEYGVLRWPLAEIAAAAGVPIKFTRELTKNYVLKGSDALREDFIHYPKHAGQSQPPVVLVKADGGSCWFSSRFVRDKWRSEQRGKSSRFTPDNQPSRSPTRREGERLGDGPSFAFAFSSAVDTTCASDSSYGAREILARALRGIGYSDCSPSAPEVVQMAQHQVSAEELLAAASGKSGKPLSYLLQRVLGKRQDAATIAAEAPKLGVATAVDPVAAAVAEETRRIEDALLDIRQRRDVLGVLTAEAAKAEAMPLMARLESLREQAAEVHS